MGNQNNERFELLAVIAAILALVLIRSQFQTYFIMDKYEKEHAEDISRAVAYIRERGTVIENDNLEAFIHCMSMCFPLCSFKAPPTDEYKYAIADVNDNLKWIWVKDKNRPSHRASELSKRLKWYVSETDVVEKPVEDPYTYREKSSWAHRCKVVTENAIGALMSVMEENDRMHPDLIVSLNVVIDKLEEFAEEMQERCDYICAEWDRREAEKKVKASVPDGWGVDKLEISKKK